MIKEYQPDIIFGLICERWTDKKGNSYLVFLDENGRIKWWIYPIGRSTHCKLFHRHGSKHSQQETGKAHELMEYIAKHECYERALIPTFSYEKGDVQYWNRILKAGVCE